MSELRTYAEYSSWEEPVADAVEFSSGSAATGNGSLADELPGSVDFEAMAFGGQATSNGSRTWDKADDC